MARALFPVIHRRIAAGLVAMQVSLTGTPLAQAQPSPPWENAQDGTARIALPRTDGSGLPTIDATGAPLKIDVTLDRFPPSGETADEIARKLMESLQRVPGLRRLAPEKREALTLVDGTPAQLVTAVLVLPDQQRSLQMKLVAQERPGDTLVVTGKLSGATDGGWLAADSGLGRWLRALVISLRLDGREPDAKALEAAWGQREHSR